MRFIFQFNILANYRLYQKKKLLNKIDPKEIFSHYLKYSGSSKQKKILDNLEKKIKNNYSGIFYN